MGAYTKPWLCVDDQVAHLAERGLEIDDADYASELLKAVGYYRLSGYLFPFRESEQYVDDCGRTQVQVLDKFRPGTRLSDAKRIIDFDRQLRMLALEGTERIEVAVRMRMGYVLGRSSAFAYEQRDRFIETFTAEERDLRDPAPSKHVQWLQRVNARRANSDEQFVKHFRDEYDDRMPVWALTEILEFGQLSRLFAGLNQADAEEIAQAFDVPTKRIAASWLASLNYVRTVSAHHARLFNRKCSRGGELLEQRNKPFVPTKL